MFKLPLPAWAVMWGLAGSIYLVCKWVTWRTANVHAIPWWRHAGYLGAWPGMDAVAFLTRSAPPPRIREWLLATITFAAGVAVIIAAAVLIPANQSYFLGWVGMLGIVLTLHFGLFR